MPSKCFNSARARRYAPRVSRHRRLLSVALAAGILLQAGGCFIDWEAALEQGLTSLSGGIAISFVDLLLRDLIPGNIGTTFGF